MPVNDPFSVTEPGALGLMAHVLQECEFCHFTFDGDAYYATCVYNDGGKMKRFTACHETILGMLRALTSFTRDEPEPKRVCPGCDTPWGWSGFSSNISSPSGKCRFCKICERKRVKKWTTQKKAAENLATVVLGGKRH